MLPYSRTRTPEEPTNDWIKHAKKALNNASKYAEKVAGKTGERLRERISQKGEKLDRLSHP